MLRNKACTTDGGAHPRLYMQVRAYDETPIKLRFKAMDGQQDSATSKLFVTDQRFAALYSTADPGSSSSWFCVEGALPTQLQVISKNSAPVIAKALEQSVQRPWDQMVHESFPHVLRIVTTDDYSANHAAEELLSEQDEQYEQEHRGVP